MKLDLSIRSYDLGAVGQYARKAQELGYDCLWSSETQHDPFLPLAVAATVATQNQVQDKPVKEAVRKAFARLTEAIGAHVDGE